jgi:hypothetical protein
MAAQRGHKQHVDDIQSSLKKLREYSSIAERSVTASAESKSASAGA